MGADDQVCVLVQGLGSLQHFRRLPRSLNVFSIERVLSLQRFRRLPRSCACWSWPSSVPSQLSLSLSLSLFLRESERERVRVGVRVCVYAHTRSEFLDFLSRPVRVDD